MMTAIQFVEDCGNESEALTMLTHLQSQVCYIGGRVLSPGSGKPWRVQSFHDSKGVEAGALLPDGCHLVSIPPSLMQTLHIAA